MDRLLGGHGDEAEVHLAQVGGMDGGFRLGPGFHFKSLSILRYNTAV